MSGLAALICAARSAGEWTISDDRKSSAPRKAWFAVLMAVIAWAGVIGVVYLLMRLFSA